MILRTLLAYRFSPFLFRLISVSLFTLASSKLSLSPSHMMDSQSSFQFGVEIELLMGGRKKAYSNWKSLAKDVSKRLQKAGISNHVNDGNDKSRENYSEWSIVQEVTIPSQPAKNLCKNFIIARRFSLTVVIGEII